MRDKRTNLELLASDETAPQFFKYQRGIDAARLAYNLPLPRDDIRVALFYGNPGTGKSHTARETFPEAYWKDNTKWWAGYAGQTQVIWDEFGGWSCPPSDFNKVFDKYPHQVEVKGGSVALQATDLIIISNFMPGTWWDPEKTRVDPRTIIRRIHRFYVFKEIGSDPIEFADYEEFKDFLYGVK